MPGCKGLIEPGKRADGTSDQWCVVCERRILQLRALQQRPPAPETTGEITDAALLELVRQRLVLAQAFAKLTKRSTNLIGAAIKDGSLPSVVLGRRIRLIPLRSSKEWNDRWKRKTPENRKTAELVEALPQESAQAIPLELWAKRAKREPGLVQAWERKHRSDAHLKRRAAIDKRGRAIVLYWWEVTRA